MAQPIGYLLNGEFYKNLTVLQIARDFDMTPQERKKAGEPIPVYSKTQIERLLIRLNGRKAKPFRQVSDLEVVDFEAIKEVFASIGITTKRVKIEAEKGTIIPGVASHAGYGKKIKVRPERRNPTTDIVRSAMKATAKDVQSPKVVRDGTVKLKENKDLVKLGKEVAKSSTAKISMPSEKVLKVSAEDQRDFRNLCSRDEKFAKWRLGEYYSIPFKKTKLIVCPANGETNFDQPGLSHGMIHFVYHTNGERKVGHCGTSWFFKNAKKLVIPKCE